MQAIDGNIAIDTLKEPLDRAAAQAEFMDVYRNRFDSSGVRRLYEAKRRFPLSSTNAISVRQPELAGLVRELDTSLDSYKSPDSGSIGNGLYLLLGSLASPRLPSVEDYAKVLVLAASRIGSERVVELLAGWLKGKGIRFHVCVLLMGIETEGKLAPVDGMLLDTLPTNGDDFPRSLLIDEHDIRYEQFAKRAMLSIEYETICALYAPDAAHESFPALLASL